MDGLYSTTVSINDVLDAFDVGYSALKEVGLIEHAKLSRVNLGNNKYKINLELECTSQIGGAGMDKDFEISSGDTIKIDLEK